MIIIYLFIYIKLRNWAINKGGEKKRGMLRNCLVIEKIDFFDPFDVFKNIFIYYFIKQMVF